MMPGVVFSPETTGTPAAIEDLIGRRVQDWEEDEDGDGEPYWEALLDGAVREPVNA
jgi:hypothetical protein